VGKIILRLYVLLIAAILLLQVYFFVQKWWWIDHNPISTSFIRERLAEFRETVPDAQLQFTWVSYARISNNPKRVIFAAEDANFFEHDGVDWNALQKAYEKNEKKGQVVRGGSTIT